MTDYYSTSSSSTRIQKILINSADRDSSSNSSTDFRITTIIDFGKAKYDLCHVVIPYSKYTIDSTNDLLRFTENLTSKTGSITNGYYNDVSLPSAIATGLNAGSLGTNSYSV